MVKIEYCKITHISSGLIEVRKHFLVGLHSWGLIYGGTYIRGIFRVNGRLGLTGDLCMPKIYHSVSNQRD